MNVRAGLAVRSDKLNHTITTMNLSESIHDATDKAKDVLDHAAETTTDKAHDLLDKAADAKDSLLSKAADLKDDLLDKAADVKSKLFDKAADAKSALFDKAGDAKDAVLDYTPSGVKKAGEKVADAFDDLTTTQKILVSALLAAGLTYLLTRKK
ncbi:hypothetical protein GCM10027594_14230 [Hymenobacter agri]